MFEDIIGHTEITTFFENVLTKGRVSHAYCFSGRDHSGKFTVAQAVSRLLLQTDKLHAHPDIQIVERIRDEKTDKLKKDISITQIRHAIQFLSQSPHYKDGYKILIIKDADALSTAASNSLLKTLEEPKGKRVLFLLTKDTQKMLPTILSRCQHMMFSPVAINDMMHYAQTSSVAQADQLVEHADGLPGLLVQWMEHPDKYKDHEAEMQRFQNLIGKPLYEKLQLVEELFGDKTDHIQARDNLSCVLGLWHSSLTRLQDTLDPKTCIALDHHMRRARELLTKNIHPRLLVEQIMIQLP